MPPFRATPLVRALLCSAALCLPTPSHTAGLEASASATPPDIYGPGAVLRAGNVRMKVTNAGVLGNPFPNLSTDPAATWPDSSGVEYLNNIGFAVAAKDLAPPAGAAAYRVSYLTEWSPVSSNAIDRIYRTFETQSSGKRLINDDGDVDPWTGEALVDEDFLDGRDDDGDGLVDEDFDAIGHETFTCLMRDDGAYSPGGAHVPLGLEVRQMAWAYGPSGLENVNPVRYVVTNRSGHVLDSVFVGFRVDMDAGPASQPDYFFDDRSFPGYPHGEFVRVLGAGEPQRQFPHAPIAGISPDSALCPRVPVRVNGFSVTDGDGDGGQTPGMATFLLLDHTTDALGVRAPTRTRFRAFRSFRAGQAFGFGGSPTNDAERWALMSSTENVDPATGFITGPASGVSGDWQQWCSVGPFRNLADGQSVTVTIGFAVRQGTPAAGDAFPAHYAAYLAGTINAATLLAAHPVLAHALDVQRVRDGRYDFFAAPPSPDFHGRESVRRLPPGSAPLLGADCRDDAPRLVTDKYDTWFDFDCDWCTGPWEWTTQTGLVNKTWDVSTDLVAVESGPDVTGRGPHIVSVAPNPGRSDVRLAFDLGAPSVTRVTVHDLGGRIVRLLELAPCPSGRHAAVWDGRDAFGRAAPAGIYFMRVAAGGREDARKVVRLN